MKKKQVAKRMDKWGNELNERGETVSQMIARRRKEGTLPEYEPSEIEKRAFAGAMRLFKRVVRKHG